MRVPFLFSASSKLIEVCFQDLLTNKHLYQCSRIDETQKAKARKEVVSEAEGNNGKARGEEFDHELSGAWTVTSGEHRVLRAATGMTTSVDAPRIETHCHECGKRVAFVCLYVNTMMHGFGDETFSMTYECQGLCDKTKVCFMIRRKGEKLQLVGRDTFEAVDIPSAIKAPKDVKKFYSDALVAYHGGQVLPSIFMLRTFIEQYWKSIPGVMEAVKNIAKPRGDELSEAYKNTLPVHFREIYPTLSAEYEALSGAIHSATADETVLTAAFGEIERHFTAVSALQLKR